MRLSEYDKAALKEFIITNDDSDNFFTVDASYQDAIKTFIANSGDNSDSIIESVYFIIMTIIKRIMREFGENHAWIQLRRQLPFDAFELERWHTDGRYVEGNTNIYNSKFVMALKGASTLFCELSSDAKHEYIKLDAKLGRKTLDEDYRKEMSSFLKENNAHFYQVKVDSGCGCMFVHGGDMMKAAIHSEPNVTSERLFLSVVPMAEAKVREYKMVQEERAKKRELI
jgi:dUTPase